MSSTTSVSDGVFSEAEKVNIRRFCGYSVAGSASSSVYFFSVNGDLEWKMNNLSSDEYIQARDILTQLLSLETSFWGAASTMDTASAAAWVRNPSELENRRDMLVMARRYLCDFLGVVPGPALGDHAAVVI